jgi:hypothetical protein
MPQVIVDDVALREEGLLTPARKPVGLVRIDRGNPLTKGLVCVNLQNDEQVYNYAQKNFGAWSSSYPASIRTSEKGKVTFYDGAIDFSSGDIVYPFTSIQQNTDDFSIAISSTMTQTVSAGEAPHVVSAKDSVIERFALLAFGNSGGTLYFSVSASSVNSAIDTGIEIDDSKWRNCVVTYADSGDRKSRVHVDGVEYVAATAASGTLIAYPATNGGVYLGNRDVSFSRAWHGDIGYFFMWNRKLTKTESDSINIDPYQFLIPA